jgi:hypothetical protein
VILTGSPPSEAAPAAESASAQPAPAGTESQGTQDTPVTPAGDENQGAKPKSVAEAVFAALKPKEGITESSPNSETGTDAPGAEDQPLPDEVTTEELSRYHSRTRRRIQQLLDKNKASATEVGQLKPLAEQAQRINQFVKESGLGWPEVNSGFELMRLLKTDPVEARKQLEPIWSALNKLCGYELPPDLQQKVDQGFVDEATARDLAQSKARAHLAQSAQTRTVQTIQQQREQTQRQQFGASVQSAIKTFEDNWRKSDPDYAALSGRVQEKVELALSRMAAKGEALKSPADAVKLVEDARNAVRAEMKPYIQKREPIAPLPGGGVTAHGAPKPRNFVEAVQQGLRA